MTSMEKHVLRYFALALMYLFAAPVLLCKWLLQMHKELRAIERIRQGAIDCPYCGYENPLNRMATCAKCRATEPSSVLRCSFCKTTFKTITCDQCSATVRVV